jgi:ubiquinone/menaquinone biosynthesis C-methylase UbiE
MNLNRNLALTWNLGRAAHFASQQQLLPLVARLATGEKPWAPPRLAEKRKQLLAAAYSLLKEDARNIGAGLYPLEVLKPESSLKHSLRLMRIVADAAGLSRRRKKRAHKDFSSEATAELGDSPEYYRRNFHFQTDGYLSSQSAELYDHQVDLLFLGTTDAMRRALIAAMKRMLPAKAKLLEVGCGTGRLTHFATLALPAAKITAMDPSAPYLEKAKENAGPGVKFVKGFGEERHFKAKSFDGVYSAFLCHELPTKVRAELLKEAVRVTKKGGVIAILDSLQLGDRPEFDWALKRFPIDFHEPFYKAYTLDPMGDWPKKIKGLELVECSYHFLGKVCVFRVTR